MGAASFPNRANCAFRKRAFEQVGLFRADFQRVKNGVGSLEDHELLLRLWQAGRKGIYLPDLTVTAEVQPDVCGKPTIRMAHRTWPLSCHAALRTAGALQTRQDPGRPAHLYREL